MASVDMSWNRLIRDHADDDDGDHDDDTKAPLDGSTCRVISCHPTWSPFWPKMNVMSFTYLIINFCYHCIGKFQPKKKKTFKYTFYFASGINLFFSLFKKIYF